MNHKHAFIDTNTLIHFIPLEDVNWVHELDAASVTLVLAPVVLRELDQHKELHPKKKLKKRARALVSKLSRLFDKGAECEIRDGVTLRFEANDPTIDFERGLNRGLNDDWLLASVLQFRRDYPDSNIVLVTADLGLKVKAAQRNVAVRNLPDELRLPDEPDDEEKTIRELQAKLEEHASRMPRLRLIFPGKMERFETFRTQVEPLTEASIQEDTDAQRRLMMLTDLAVPHFPLSATGEHEYQRLLDEHLVRYANYLRRRQEVKIIRARTIMLNVQVINEGTGPADDVDVILLFPPLLAVRDMDPVPPEPGPPSPPQRPSGGEFESLQLAHLSEEIRRIVDIPLPPLRIPHFPERSNVSRPKLSRNRVANKVEVHVRRSKQNQCQPLGKLYVSFADQNVVTSFQVEYVIQAANVPHEIKGILPIVVKEPSSEETTSRTGTATTSAKLRRIMLRRFKAFSI